MSSEVSVMRSEAHGARELKSSNDLLERMTHKLNGYLSQRATANTWTAEEVGVARPSYLPLGSVYSQLSSTGMGWNNNQNHASFTNPERYAASRIAQIERKIEKAQAENLLMQRLAQSDKELLLTNYATRIQYFNDKFAHKYFKDNYLQEVPRIPTRIGPVPGMFAQVNSPQNLWEDKSAPVNNEGKLNKSLTRSTSQLGRSESKMRSKTRLDDKSFKERKSAKSNMSSKSKSILSRSASKASKSRSAVRTLNKSVAKSKKSNQAKIKTVPRKNQSSIIEPPLLKAVNFKRKKVKASRKSVSTSVKRAPSAPSKAAPSLISKPKRTRNKVL